MHIEEQAPDVIIEEELFPFTQNCCIIMCVVILVFISGECALLASIEDSLSYAWDLF